MADSIAITAFAEKMMEDIISNCLSCAVHDESENKGTDLELDSSSETGWSESKGTDIEPETDLATYSCRSIGELPYPVFRLVCCFMWESDVLSLGQTCHATLRQTAPYYLSHLPCKTSWNISSDFAPILIKGHDFQPGARLTLCENRSRYFKGYRELLTKRLACFDPDLVQTLTLKCNLVSSITRFSANLSSLTLMQFDGPWSWDAVASCTQLQSLHLQDAKYRINWNVLRGLKHLKKLVLIGYYDPDFQYQSGTIRAFRRRLGRSRTRRHVHWFANLSSLHLGVSHRYHDYVDRLATMVNLENLKNLTLGGTWRMVELEFGMMKNLETLDLGKINLDVPLGADIVHDIKRLTRLEKLTLWKSCHQELDPLLDLTSLRILRLSDRGYFTAPLSDEVIAVSWGLPTVSGVPSDLLSSLTNSGQSSGKQLEVLEFPVDFGVSLSSFSRFSGLRYLSFDKKNSEFNRSLEHLCCLTKLEYLSLGNKFDKSLSPLRNLISLVYLRLGRNFNQTLEPIQGLFNLRFLMLYGIFNQSLEPLRNLTRLEQLELPEKFNKSLDPLARLKKLKFLELYGKYNQPIDALSGLNLEYVAVGHAFLQSYEPLFHIKTLQIVKLFQYRRRTPHYYDCFTQSVLTEENSEWKNHRKMDMRLTERHHEERESWFKLE